MYNVTLDLNKILDITFTNKSEGYFNLLFYLMSQLYKNIFNENIKLKILESFFENKLLIQKAQFFFSETLKELKPEIYSENNSQNDCITNFMNFNKLTKYKNIIELYNNINSEVFHE